MMDIPDSSNFYASVGTDLAGIVDVFVEAGWQVRKAGWASFEVSCSWAELIVEGDAVVLVHGPVARVTERANELVTLLEASGRLVKAEAYGSDGSLLITFPSGT